MTRIVEKRDPQGFQIAVEKHVLKKCRNLPENDPEMRSQKVIVLLFFKGLGPRVPQGGPKDLPRAPKVTPKLPKVTPKLPKWCPDRLQGAKSDPKAFKSDPKAPQMAARQTPRPKSMPK